NPSNGALLALASYPSWNPIAAVRDRGYLTRLLASDREGRLFNRATQGTYPPGSTFKPVVAQAALATGLVDEQTTPPCTASLRVGGMVFRNFDGGVRGSLTLAQALAESCDTWFYRLGQAFYARQRAYGSLDLQAWAQQLGLGAPTGLDIGGESAGSIP